MNQEITLKVWKYNLRENLFMPKKLQTDNR